MDIVLYPAIAVVCRHWRCETASPSFKLFIDIYVVVSPVIQKK